MESSTSTPRQPARAAAVLAHYLPKPRILVLQKGRTPEVVESPFADTYDDSWLEESLLQRETFPIHEIDPWNSEFEHQYASIQETSQVARDFLSSNYHNLTVSRVFTPEFGDFEMYFEICRAFDEAFRDLTTCGSSSSLSWPPAMYPRGIAPWPITYGYLFSFSCPVPDIDGCVDGKRDTLLLMDREISGLCRGIDHLNFSRVQNLALSIGGIFKNIPSVLRFLLQYHPMQPLNLTLFFNTSGADQLTKESRCYKPKPYFLEIDDNIPNINPYYKPIKSDYLPSRLKRWEYNDARKRRERQLKSILEKANTLRREFEALQRGLKQRLGGIKLKVCLLGWIFPLDVECFDGVEVLDDMENPDVVMDEYYMDDLEDAEALSGEGFYMEQRNPTLTDLLRIPHVRPKETSRYAIKVKEFELGFQCLADGTPLTHDDMYTGVDRLFEEE